MNINFQKLKRVDLVVGGYHVGSICLTEANVAPIVIAPSSSKMLPVDREEFSEHSDDQKVRIENEKYWTERDDEALLAAVNTLGVDSWDRIVKYWFNESKTKSECRRRWDTLMMKDKNHSDGTKVNKVGPKTQILADRTNIKQVSLRKRRELEALEERKLFGKERPQLEKELIHRAYIVGQNKLEKIMRMNDAESKGKFGTTISISSVVSEMERVDPSVVECSLKSKSKNVRKLPRSVMEINEQNLLSPIHSDAMRSWTKNSTGILNFSSSQLPVAQIIENERVRIRKMENEKRKREEINVKVTSKVIASDVDEETALLAQCISPPLKRPFPFLL